MSKVYRFRARTRKEQASLVRTREEIAAQYVARLYSGELTDSEEQGLQQWRQKNKQNEQSFQEMMRIWDLSQHLYQPAETKKRSQASKWVASLFLAFSLLGSWLFWQAQYKDALEGTTKVVQTEINSTETSSGWRVAEAEPLATQGLEELKKVMAGVDYYATEVGEVRRITLEDGTSVTLNTATILQVKMAATKRFVTMVEGEAFFEVAKDSKRPFIIDTGEQKIQVVGTKFNVRKDAEVVQVAVVEGKVRVGRTAMKESLDQTTVASIEKEAQDYLLEAGVVGSFSNTAEVVAAANLERAKAAQDWRRGVFKFDDVPLEEVIRELNRYRKKKIRMAEHRVGTLRVSGVFHLADNQRLLQALEDSLPISFTDTGAEILLKEKNKNN